MSGAATGAGGVRCAHHHPARALNSLGAKLDGDDLIERCFRRRRISLAHDLSTETVEDLCIGLDEELLDQAVTADDRNGLEAVDSGRPCLRCTCRMHLRPEHVVHGEHRVLPELAFER